MQQHRNSLMLAKEWQHHHGYTLQVKCEHKQPCIGCRDNTKSNKCVQLKLIWPIVFMITWIVSKQQLLFWRNKCCYQLQDGVNLAMATAKAAEYSGALTKFQFSKMIAESRWTTHISRVRTQRRMTYEGHMPNLIADIFIRFFWLNVWHWILTWKKKV